MTVFPGLVSNAVEIRRVRNPGISEEPLPWSIVLISQSTDPEIITAGRAAAERLGLEFEHRHIGLDPFAGAVADGVAVSLTRRVA